MKTDIVKKSSSPMMQQYFDLKEKYKGYILFFRMGDFYEMFFDDAKIASKILDIALTKRGKEKDLDIPMCGIPYHSYEPYLEKLIKNNLRVAVCEQMETPEEAKKRGYKAIVRRDVVRVVTSGTLTEDNLLDPKCANYLLSISVDLDYCGLSWVDISTGKFYVKKLRITDLASSLTLIDPQEILIDETLLNRAETRFFLNDYRDKIVNFAPSYFETKKNEITLKEFYNVKFLDSFGSLEKLEIAASGALISYIQTTQKSQLPKLDFPKSTSKDKFLQIDNVTLKSLEIFNSRENSKSLFSFMDQTKTASGARSLRLFLSNPLIDKDQIERRLNKVSFFLENTHLLQQLRDILGGFPDLERAMHKLLLSRGGARDWLIIINAIHVIKRLDYFYSVYAQLLPKEIQTLFTKLKGIENLLEEYDVIVDTPPLLLRDGNFIKSGVSKELDYLRNINVIANDKIKKLEIEYRQQTNINNLRIKSTNILGYYVEVSKNSMSLMDEKLFIHRQTLINHVRFVTEDLLQIQNELHQATDNSLEIELKIFSNLLKKLDKDVPILKKAIKTITLLDIYTNFAFIAEKHHFSKPELTDHNILNIEGGFHPVVKDNLPEDIHEFVTNDCSMQDENNFWLITGPNMAGKSTFLRQNALIIVLAQAGSFVPAQAAEIGVVDKIFSRVGASDDLSKGRSTFMVEMLETAAILNNATSRSFLILDEIGRGTATFDGMSLAWAITEHIHNKIKARSLFATHYHELSELSRKLKNCVCYYSTVREYKEKIIFTHKIVAGVAEKSYGIAVASLAGLPKTIISRANEIIKSLESGHKIEKSSELPLFDHLANDNKTKVEPDNMDKLSDGKILDKDIGTSRTYQKNKVFENLKNLDIDKITPKEALDILYEYQSKIE